MTISITCTHLHIILHKCDKFSIHFRDSITLELNKRPMTFNNIVVATTKQKLVMIRFVEWIYQNEKWATTECSSSTQIYGMRRNYFTCRMMNNDKAEMISCVSLSIQHSTLFFCLVSVSSKNSIKLLVDD